MRAAVGAPRMGAACYHALPRCLVTRAGAPFPAFATLRRNRAPHLLCLPRACCLARAFIPLLLSRTAARLPPPRAPRCGTRRALCRFFAPLRCAAACAAPAHLAACGFHLQRA